MASSDTALALLKALHANFELYTRNELDWRTVRTILNEMRASIDMLESQTGGRWIFATQPDLIGVIPPALSMLLNRTDLPVHIAEISSADCVQVTGVNVAGALADLLEVGYTLETDMGTAC